MTAPPARKQPELALPTSQLLVGHVLAGAAAAILWTLGVLEGGHGTTLLLQGLCEVLLVVLVAAGTTLLLQPWVVRPAMTWAMLVLGGSLLKLVLTASLSVLLYFAAQMPVKGLLIAGFVAFLSNLIIETILIARSLSRAPLPEPPPTS